MVAPCEITYVMEVTAGLQNRTLLTRCSPNTTFWINCSSMLVKCPDLRQRSSTKPCCSSSMLLDALLLGRSLPNVFVSCKQFWIFYIWRLLPWIHEQPGLFWFVWPTLPRNKCLVFVYNYDFTPYFLSYTFQKSTLLKNKQTNDQTITQCVMVLLFIMGLVLVLMETVLVSTGNLSPGLSKPLNPIEICLKATNTGNYF